MKVKAIFGETVIGNAYCRQTWGKRRKNDENRGHKKKTKKKPYPTLHTLRSPCWGSCRQRYKSLLKKRKHKVLSPLGKDELWRLIRCVCTVVPGKIINSHEDERPRLQSSCFYNLKHAPSRAISFFYSTVIFDLNIFILSLSYFIW